MKKLILSFLLILCYAQTGLCRQLDWKILHETADSRSLADAQRLSEANPASMDEMYILGLVFLNAYKDAQAEEVFGKMIKIDPVAHEARWGRAEVLRRQGKIQESLKALEEIITVYPDFSPACISLAYIKYTQLEFKKAVQLAQKVIHQGRQSVDLSNYTRAYLISGGSRGMLARRGGPIAKAVQGLQVLPNLKKAQALQPDSAAVLFGLGSFYFLAPPIAGGDRNMAREYLERAIKADPLLADAYVRLAQVYQIKGDSVRAEALLKEALRIDPNNALAQDASSKECKFACVGMED